MPLIRENEQDEEEEEEEESEGIGSRDDDASFKVLNAVIAMAILDFSKTRQILGASLPGLVTCPLFPFVFFFFF